MVETFRGYSVGLSPLGQITRASMRHMGASVPWYKTMRVFGEYALVYLLEGSGRYVDARGLDLPVKAGDLITVLPTLGHQYGPESGGHWVELYLCFSGPVFALWESAGLLSAAQPVRTLAPIDHWRRRFASVLENPERVGMGNPLLEVCRLQQLLAETIVTGDMKDQERSQWLVQACELLEQNLSQPVNLQRLARKLNMSYPSFRRHFTQRAGQPPAAYRAQRVIDHACRLMQQRTLTDKQIALELGFCDEFHFSRRFKKITGQSPREYRRRLP